MTLGIAVIVMLTLSLWGSWIRLTSASESEAAANAEGYLFTALSNLRVDRVTTGVELNSDKTSVSQILSRSRAVELAALDSALQYLPHVAFSDQAVMTLELADRVKRLKELHAETAIALAQPKGSRPAGLSDRISREGNELIALGSVGIHREFITAAARWIMEAKL